MPPAFLLFSSPDDWYSQDSHVYASWTKVSMCCAIRIFWLCRLLRIWNRCDIRVLLLYLYLEVWFIYWFILRCDSSRHFVIDWLSIKRRWKHGFYMIVLAHVHLHLPACPVDDESTSIVFTSLITCPERLRSSFCPISSCSWRSLECCLCTLTDSAGLL